MSVAHYEPDPVRADRDRPVGEVAAYTGLTFEEVVDLRWCDIDVDRQVVEFDDEHGRTTLPLTDGVARLLHWPGCWHRLQHRTHDLHWTPSVRDFDVPPVPAA